MEELKRLYKKLLTEPGRTYDHIIRSLYRNVLQPGDVVIDVGANTGLHTIPMAEKVAPGGRVLAFEPVPETAAILEKRIRNNHLDPVVTLHNVALSKIAGEADFVVFKDRPGLSGFKISPSYGSEDRLNIEKRRMPVDTLDNLTADDLNVTFIKTDAEGADFFILQGGARLIKKNRPLIVFEGWGVKAGLAKLYGYTKEEFFGFFDEIDYVLYDTAGLRFNPGLWEVHTLNDFIAIPGEKKEEMVESLRFSVMQIVSRKLQEAN